MYIAVNSLTKIESRWDTLGFIGFKNEVFVFVYFTEYHN